MRTQTMLALAVSIAVCSLAVAEDWPKWGRTPQRNMVSPEKSVPTSFDPGRYAKGTDRIDMSTTRNVKWVAKVGSQTYGNPTVASGRVYVGTNNEGNPDPRFQGDYSLLKCLDEKTGELLWQLVVPKLGAGKVSDWEYLGICSSAAVDGDRVYIVTNRCEIVCLDAQGLANGNDGVKDEGQYMAGPDESPVELGPQDADILWRFDMREELGVFPHNITSSSPLVVGDLVYIATSNGVDWSHTNIPNPKAPSLVAFDKYTGELKGEEITGMSEQILHGGWSSPAYGEAGSKAFLIFGGPDGLLYAFDPIPVHDEEEDLDVLKEVWRYDANPRHFRFKDGDESKPIKYARPEGPSEFIATPVVHKGRVYAAIGQDPEHGEGIGNLVCLDLATGKKIWDYPEKINRTISTVSVTDDGLLFVADFSGFAYCFDADKGELLWKHDTLSHIWGSTLVADGKVFLGNEDGDLTILAAAREKKLICDPINFNDPIYSTPVVANGVLYIATQTQLYAIGQ
jgi:outer membrane protein assembly factor BamB